MTRRVQYTFFALLLTAAASASAIAQQSITDVVKQVLPAVVTVITYDPTGEKDAQGTGFFVDATHVVTDWHVVDGATRIEVKTNDGKTFRVKGITAGSEDSDVATLELTQPNSTVVPLRIVSQVPDPGERVVVVGSPLGLEASISDGVVSGVRDIPELGRVIQISAPISRGSSGSPVVNMRGEVVGVAQAIRGGGQNLNFAIPGAQVLAMKPTPGPMIASKPAEQGRGPAMTSEEAFQTGLELFRANAYEQALPLFLEAARQNPTNHLAWFMAGHCYINTGDYGKAAAAFMNSVKAKPDFVDGYCSLGAALGLLGQHTAALEAFNTALKIDPKSSVGHYGRGLTYLSLGQRDKAMAEYKILQKLDPDLAGRLGELVQ